MDIRRLYHCEGRNRISTLDHSQTLQLEMLKELMDTTIIDSSIFLECTGNHFFIEGLYPHGLGEVLVGQFGLDIGRFSINIHIYVEPAKKVPKWGVWGKDYNVLVLEFLGDGLTDIKIDNWSGFGKAQLRCRKDGNKYGLYQKGVDWNFEVLFGMLSFQRSSTYIDGDINDC